MRLRDTLLIGLFLGCSGLSYPSTTLANDFFETKIRPVLVEHCYSCHSSEAQKNKKLKGGLLLDTRAGVVKGGDSGPAVVPGKPLEGTLLKALRYTDEEMKMPPKGKLSDQVLADFEAWVKMGAPDPRDAAGPVASGTMDLVKGRQFWSFQPVREYPVPTIANQTVRVVNDVDRFLLARMLEKGVQQNPLADRRTLIRRVTFDLIGLPPTPEEVEAFVADSRPEAYRELVDRLLASPQYGGRWARYWLDVARYAEDQAHTFAVTPRTFAWRYRDWVIQAFNQDMPYDRFVRLQIAGDLMDASEGDSFTRLGGLGFLGLGAEYYKNSAKEQAIADELDDRVDTLTRGFLGLTVSCARCHDHKFDPIPQRDYYSIAGIYNGSALGNSTIATPQEQERYQAAEKRLKDQEEVVRKWQRKHTDQRIQEALKQSSGYLTTAWKVHAFRKAGGKISLAEAAEKNMLMPYFLERWLKATEPKAKLPDYLKTFADTPLSAGSFKALADVPVPDAIQKLASQIQELAQKENGKKLREGDKAPFQFNPDEYEKHLIKADEKLTLKEMRAEAEKRKKEMPPPLPVVHTIQGGGQGMKVFVRGNPLKPGEPAPKGFLQVLPTPTPASPKDFTRLDLANAIASKDNPLTARVIVNRVWQQHFGKGLVGTASNFGSLGDRPQNAELFDTLTHRFIASGWSLKWLHREILLSATYQSSSQASKTNAEIDPGNHFLWQGKRHRLDVEAWRDTLLAVAGNLDPAIGGPTFDLNDSNSKRRTVYAKISRHELNELLRLFDFPDANVTSAGRNSTTVPQQQLFVLNSDFMVNQARAFASRAQKAGATDPERIRAAYRIAFQRQPSDEELRLGQAYLASRATGDSSKDRLTRWEQYAQALLASNEILYVD